MRGGRTYSYFRFPIKDHIRLNNKVRYGLFLYPPSQHNREGRLMVDDIVSFQLVTH